MLHIGLTSKYYNPGLEDNLRKQGRVYHSNDSKSLVFIPKNDIQKINNDAMTIAEALCPYYDNMHRNSDKYDAIVTQLLAYAINNAISVDLDKMPIKNHGEVPYYMDE